MQFLLYALVGIEFYESQRTTFWVGQRVFHDASAASCSILIYLQATACAVMYPNSQEEDSISWKLGVDGNFSIKNAWGSLRIKATNVDCNKMRELLFESASASVRNRWEHILLDSNSHSHNSGGDGDVEFASTGQNYERKKKEDDVLVKILKKRS
ncbi:hypothetical protein POTOM_025226 [Populus tomentosa]|uniref:Uncharacterized protein n=1 Tax=Populus tomentosa TaxID=118781 RepID=A0A8X7ZNR2_POPTO|nr:hypothetical protein POTOM_025226 [Populus tomentosa]